MIILTLMIFASVFMSVIALSCGIQTVRQSPENELKRKLQRMTGTSEVDPARKSACDLVLKTPSPTSVRFFSHLPLMGRMQRLLEHSGTHVSPVQFILLTGIIVTLSAIIVYAVSGNMLIALLSLLLVGVMPFVYLIYRKKQRQTLFDEQLPDALTMVARSLRAGHSLSGAIELISQEMPDPTGSLFKIAFDQQQLGIRISDSLKTLVDKIESIDLQFFITIIRINSETGGNLAEILDKLADTIRSRLQIRRQVKVYSAQGRLSGYILTVLPLVVFIMFNILNPGYMKVFYTERICQLILVGALLAQSAGFLMIRKIVDIRI